MPQIGSEYQNVQFTQPDKPTGGPVDSIQTPADAVSRMPNADKLTPYERGIYNVLPGFAQSDVGKALSAFNETLPGKALQYLDVFAEGTERAIGTVVQALNNKDTQFDWKSAWYAGSLTYDTAHLPMPTYDANGKLTGLRLNMDLPGSVQGLATARKNIQDYVAQGMSYHDALGKAREDYYNGLGALALRGQLQDAVGHALLDPSVPLLAELKPVDFLKATASEALASKTLLGAEDVTKLAETAKAAGDLEKAAAYTSVAEKLASGEVKQVNTLDKIAIFATGGNVFEPTKLEEFLGKTPVLKGFVLSPDSKAAEAVNVVGDNVATNIVGRLWNNPNAEEEMANAVQRAAQGAVGPEFGHALLTPQGRGIQALLAGDGAFAASLLDNYKAVANERGLLGILSGALDQSGTDILKNIKENPSAVFSTLSRSDNPEIMARLQAGLISPDTLKNLAETLDGMPLNKEMFAAHLLDATEGYAMQQAVLQFGVQQRGAVSRWANALKSAESLAFMRLNPAYPIRNGVNNEITMMARGLFNTMSDGEIDAFWKTAGFVPPRLSEDFHLGSDIGKGAAGVLHEATSANGAPEKVQNFFRKLQLGGFDTSAWARGLERSASRRAFTKGYQEFFHEFWKPDRVESFMDSAVADSVRQANPDLFDHLNNAIKASQGSTQKLDELLKSNLNLNVDSILAEAEKGTGTKITDALGTDTVQYLRDNLPQAVNDGKLNEFRVALQRRIDDHIDALFKQHVQDITDQIKNQVLAGGPQGWHDALGKAQMMWMDGEIEHSLKISPAADAAKAAVASGDYRRANSLWAKVFTDEQTHFARYEMRMNGMYDGLEQAWKELKADAQAKGLAFDMPNISEVRKSFTDTRKAWKEFFDYRQKSLQDFFQAGKERKITWTQLQADLEQRYGEVAAKESTLSRQADKSVVDLIKDPQVRDAVGAFRGQISEMRDQLRKDVQAFRQQLLEAKPADRQQLYTDFWKDRQQKLTNIRYAEQATTAAMQGDPKALDIASQMAVKPLSVPLSDAATKVPRSELPPELSKTIEDHARQLLTELNAGEPGKRVVIAPTAESTTNDYKSLRVPSSNAGWYREMYSRLGVSKDALQKALQKIIDDNGADKGTNVERLKNLILERIFQGDEKAGFPPDLYAMHQLGADDATMMRGLIEFRNLSGSPDASLLDALEASGMPADQLAKYVDGIRPGQITDPQDIIDIMDQGKTWEQAVEELRAKAEAPQGPAVSDRFIADVKKVVPDIMPLDLITEQANYGRAQPALDAVMEAAKTQMSKTPTMVQNLPEDLQKQVTSAVERAKEGFSGAQLSATKYAEFRRDSALLNYNRRTNFDNWLGNAMPYVFWTTGSMQAWALESIQRPAMVTNYLRYKKFLETAGAPIPGLPSRFKDSLRIKLPFAPSWMGSQFVDPMRMALPFESFSQPFEQWQQNQQSTQGRAERLLQSQLQGGKITQDQFNQAMNHQGPDWQNAVSQTQQNDSSQNYDAYDFISMVGSPHVPIQWAYNAATGHPENIGPATPMTTMLKNAATTLGVQDWNNSNYNVEAKIRKSIGLPAYDKWDNYKIDRQISNLSTEGKFSLDDIKQAMALSSEVQRGTLTSAQAEQQNPIYAEAAKRANQEASGGSGLTFGLSLLGINVKSLPEGEMQLRSLQGQFSDAYAKYKKANDTITQYATQHPDMSKDQVIAAITKSNPSLKQDASALTDFFNAHPEYETRLALFDKPEDRLKKFQIDNLWARWNDLPKVTKDELQAQLGSNFSDSILNKQTRSYDNVSLQELQVWTKLMGGSVAGVMQADQKNLVDLFSGQLKLTKPETAWRAQVFYDTRTQRFPNWYAEQNAYYDPSQKSKMTPQQTAELKQYWDWRRQFMGQNPDIVPFITDNQKSIAAALKTQRNPQNAIPTAQEINLSDSMQTLLNDYRNGGELPEPAKRQMELLAARYRMPVRDLYGMYGLPTP